MVSQCLTELTTTPLHVPMLQQQLQQLILLLSAHNVVATQTVLGQVAAVQQEVISFGVTLQAFLLIALLTRQRLETSTGEAIQSQPSTLNL